MPAVESTPPIEAVDSAQSAWQGGRGIHLWRRQAKNLVKAHRVYVAQLRALSQPTAIADIAEPVGWRFLPKKGVAVEVSDRDRAVQIERGPWVGEAADVFKAAADDPRLAEGAFELRMLRVPEAGLTVMWLVAPESRDEVVVPLHPAPQGFEPLRDYEAPEFLRAASELARAKLHLYATAENGEEIGS